MWNPSARANTAIHRTDCIRAHDAGTLASRVAIRWRAGKQFTVQTIGYALPESQVPAFAQKAVYERLSGVKGRGRLTQREGNKPDPLVERLAADYGADLLRYISRRVRSSADSRDIAQESYVRLLRLERKDLIRDPLPYLYRIAANVLYEFELKRREELNGLLRWSAENRSQGVAAPAGGGDAESLVLQDRLQSALRQLSPTCRAVLLLHRKEGMTYDEIADEIGISSSMVKKYLSQALRHCRQQLKEFR